jgi:hypothetical protein
VRLLGLARGSPVIVLFSVDVDPQGKPIQPGRSRSAPNWIEFVIDYDMLQSVFGRSGGMQGYSSGRVLNRRCPLSGRQSPSVILPYSPCNLIPTGAMLTSK